MNLFFSKNESFYHALINTFHFARFLLLIFNIVSSLFISFFSSHACVYCCIMWKTRFEVSTGNSTGLSRHRTLSSPSTILHHHYYSRPSPTVPRVREDSPSAIVRPSPPSSIPNLEILTEEENEDIPCSTGTNNEQPSLILITLPKRNSYQAINRHQIVLPTIVESNDHEVMIDSVPNRNDGNVFNSELIDDDGQDKYFVKLKSQDSRVATNTNYNQVTNIDIERKERSLNGNTNTELTGFILDKRINEFFQQKNEKQNKVRDIMFAFAASKCQRRNISN
jgi:hypothetical protein